MKFKEALAFYKTSEWKFGHATTLLMLGLSYFQIHELQNALDHVSKSLPILRQAGEKSMHATALASLGAIYSLMGFHKKAIESLNEALPLLQSPEDRQGLSIALIGLGGSYVQLGEKRKGLGYFSQALSLHRALDNRAAEAATLDAIAILHSGMGEYQTALDLFNQSLSLRKAIGEPDTESHSFIGIGEVYADLGQGEKAIDYFKRALDIARRVKNRSEEANALNKLGAIYHDHGVKEMAVEYFNQALQVAQFANDRDIESAILSSMATLSLSTSELPRAVELYSKALAIARAEENLNGQATSLLNIGMVYNHLGESQKALDHFNQALTTFRLLEDRNAEVATLHNIGSAHYFMREPAKALEYLGDALRISRAIGDLNGEARTLYKLGDLYRSLGDKQQALSYFNQALPIFHNIKSRIGEGVVLASLGNVYDTLGEDDKAISSLNQSLAIAQELGDRSNEATALSNIGLFYEGNEDIKSAMGFYLRSIEQREKNRTAARLEEFKINLAAIDAETYIHAILLGLRAGQSAQAFDLVERARARTLLDQLGNIRPNTRNQTSGELIQQEQSLVLELASLEMKLKQEYTRPTSSLNSNLISSLENRIAAKRREYEYLLIGLKIANPEYVSLRSINTLTLSEVQRLLSGDTTLLSYFVTPEKTVAFIIRRDYFHAVEIAVKEADLKAAIGWFRSFAHLRDPQPESLKQLYNWLIAPVKQYVKTPLLGIIPHGTLHYLPFAALTDGKRYLGDEHTVFYLPSASVLPFVQKNTRPVARRVLALSQSRAEGLPVLRYVDAEAEAVANLYNTEAFTTGSASKSGFLKRAGDYSILHIAAHAELNASSPLFARIILSTSEGDPGVLEVREIYDLDLSKVSLVVLSACNTQLGALSKGDDIVGLNRAFIYAGAPTAISSLWAVDDESTSYLMKAFYSHLKRGVSKAEALRIAQSETRKRYSHPYYWAAFVLNGDPGSITSVKASRSR